MQLPNVMGFFLGMLQMVLYGIYRNKKPRVDTPTPASNSNEEKKAPENLVNIKVVETPQQLQLEHQQQQQEAAISVEQLESPLHLIVCPD